MKLTKKIAALFTLVLLSGGIMAACSSQEDSKKSSSEKEPLTIWGMGEEAKQLHILASEFEKESGIKVKVQTIPWSNAHDKLLTTVASKNGPDVLQMGTSWMPEFQEAGALADMAPYIEKYPALKAENFLEDSVTTTKFDDKYYGIPWSSETRALFYRTDLLESVGYKEAPKTWAELEDAAAKLSKRGKDKYGILLDLKDQALPFTFARQNGSTLFNTDNQPEFNQPAFVGATEYMNNLIQKGYAPKNDLGIDPAQAFAGEDPIVGMFISGPWTIKTIDDTLKDLEGKWKVAVLPKKENNVSSLGGHNLTIFEYSKRKDDAAKFIEFASKPKTQLRWLELTNAMPTVKEALTDDKLQKDENYKVFTEQLNNAQPMPLIPQFEEIAQNYLKRFEKIYADDADIQKELDAFNKETQDLLNK